MSPKSRTYRHIPPVHAGTAKWVMYVPGAYYDQYRLRPGLCKIYLKTPKTKCCGTGTLLEKKTNTSGKKPNTSGKKTPTPNTREQATATPDNTPPSQTVSYTHLTLPTKRIV